VNIRVRDPAGNVSVSPPRGDLKAEQGGSSASRSVLQPALRISGTSRQKCPTPAYRPDQQKHRRGRHRQRRQSSAKTKRAPAKSKKPAAKTKRTSADSKAANKDGGKRLGPGQLDDMVLGYMKKNRA
jgi:hypothetical protein